MAKRGELTDKQKKFCKEYLVDFNATRASTAAGYAKNSAHVTGSKLLKNPKVMAQLAKDAKVVEEQIEVDAAWIQNQAVAVHKRCMQEISPVLYQNGDQVTDDEGNPLYRFDASNAIKSLEILGKLKVIAAFDNSVNHTASDKLVETILGARRRVNPDAESK